MGFWTIFLANATSFNDNASKRVHEDETNLLLVSIQIVCVCVIVVVVGLGLLSGSYHVLFITHRLGAMLFFLSEEEEREREF